MTNRLSNFDSYSKQIVGRAPIAPSKIGARRGGLAHRPPSSLSWRAKLFSSATARFRLGFGRRLRHRTRRSGPPRPIVTTQPPARPSRVAGGASALRESVKIALVQSVGMQIIAKALGEHLVPRRPRRFAALGEVIGAQPVRPVHNGAAPPKERNIGPRNRKSGPKIRERQPQNHPLSS